MPEAIIAPTDAQLAFVAKLCEERGYPMPAVKAAAVTDAQAEYIADLQRQLVESRDARNLSEARTALAAAEADRDRFLRERDEWVVNERDHWRDALAAAEAAREVVEIDRDDWIKRLNEVERQLDAAEAAREEWMTPFDGSGIEWHESLPSPYTYQASDFSKLGAAVHEYECARDHAREALRLIADIQPAGNEHIGAQFNNAIRLARAALDAAGMEPREEFGAGRGSDTKGAGARSPARHLTSLRSDLESLAQEWHTEGERAKEWSSGHRDGSASSHARGRGNGLQDAARQLRGLVRRSGGMEPRATLNEPAVSVEVATGVKASGAGSLSAGDQQPPPEAGEGA